MSIFKCIKCDCEWQDCNNIYNTSCPKCGSEFPLVVNYNANDYMMIKKVANHERS